MANESINPYILAVYPHWAQGLSAENPDDKRIDWMTACINWMTVAKVAKTFGACRPAETLGEFRYDCRQAKGAPRLADGFPKRSAAVQ